MQNRQHVDLDKTKRILSVIIAIVVWGFSMRFSVSGFGNGINKDEIWIGWAIAGIITGVELIWNSMKDKTNLTIWVTGVCCYIYGISTNIIGILYWQGNTIDMALANPILWAFPIILGLFLEILPEPMFVLGVTGDHNQGDFLGNLFGNKMIPTPNKTVSQPRQTTQTTPKSNYQPQNKPSGNNSGNNNPSYQRPQQTQSPQNKYEPKNRPQNNNQKPNQNDNRNRDNFFNKPTQKPQSNNDQPGRYMEMMRQKNNGFPVNPYEHSGEDQPDWDR